MELEKLTALQLGEKIKQRQVSVLDGVKTVFEQIEKQDSEVHAYLDTYKEEAYKRAEEVQKRHRGRYLYQSSCRRTDRDKR